MSAEARSIVSHHSQTDGALRSIMLVVALWDGFDTDLLTVANLSATVGINRNNMKRALQHLERRGELQRHYQGPTKPSRMEILIGCPDGCTVDHGTGES